MKNLPWYLAAAMTVSLVGMNIDRVVDLIPAVANESAPITSGIGRYINDSKSQEQAEGVTVPMPMICFASRVAEQALTAEGFRILATGYRPDGEVGPELYETWMNPETKNFVILRVVATQGLSCAIAVGPLLRPGGVTIKELEESQPKGQPL